MTELERSALLGEVWAQDKCTEKGIPLQCPWCKCDNKDMIGLSVYHDQYFYSCEACGCNGPIVYDNENCDYPERDALSAWNRRPEPPLIKKQCSLCKYYEKPEECWNGTCQLMPGPVFEPDDYCNQFESKENE